MLCTPLTRAGVACLVTGIILILCDLMWGEYIGILGAILVGIGACERPKPPPDVKPPKLDIENPN